MKHILLTIPTGPKVGLSTISIGLVRALDRQGVRVGFFKPISQPIDNQETEDKSTRFISMQTPLSPPEPIHINVVRDYVSQNKVDLLMEDIVNNFDKAAQYSDVIVVEGLLQTEEFPLGAMLNKQIAQTLSADVILVSQYHNHTPEALNRQIEISTVDFQNSIAGCIINKADIPNDDGKPMPIATKEFKDHLRSICPVFNKRNIELIGAVPFANNLLAPRTSDVAKLINATPLFEGEMDQRRVYNIELCARSIPNMMHVLATGNLLVTPADRNEIIIATAMAAINGAQIAGLVLTGDVDPDENVLNFCRKAWYTGLPVLRVNLTSFLAAKALYDMNPEIPIDDGERINQAMELVARAINSDWIRNHLASAVKSRLSPAAFRHMLARNASKSPKRIVLPEGDEPRTIQAAISCQQRGIAQCVLLGKREDIQAQAHALGVTLPANLEIIDPGNVLDRYIDPLVEMRRHKNMTEKIAHDHLSDNVVLGTMMLALGEVHGLVSGAEHSSANTVRPALQLIKTQKSAKIVSSIFFMCLPDQVLIYGDCAINPDPNAQELADIAIQSAESAKAFGMEPAVAMISYSTLGSGSGKDVDKVVEATRLVKEMRPDILIDGPLQYDAAATKDVADKKAPNSPVAGKANVFIFPDLNTGNTTYKAVQRSANLVSIGPMLQGLKKPVNDLSRGALVDDIIYTIALTAIQAHQQDNL
ncbi:phosphate acetyltransferase [Puniceicoccaceae bacterium K14]|nr:phosphate acetyltransferase [Puniceicoccaceae bacterium K14]